MRLSGRPPIRMVALSHEVWSQCALCGRPPIRMAALSHQARRILVCGAAVVGPPIRMEALSHLAMCVLARWRTLPSGLRCSTTCCSVRSASP